MLNLEPRSQILLNSCSRCKAWVPSWVMRPDVTHRMRERDLHCSPFLHNSNWEAPARLQDGGPSHNSAICDCVSKRMFLSELSLSVKDPVPGCF